MKRSSLAFLAVSIFALGLCLPGKLLAQTYTESVLYSFPEGPSGSQGPGKLVRDSAGNLYGTTLAGGPTNKTCAKSCGTIFELSANGVFTTLYTFKNGTDGHSPCCLVIDKSGNLYGLTIDGVGTVFKFAPKTKTFTTLHTFGAGSDGAFPIALLNFDSAGNLYGVADTGGTGGEGTIFKVTPKGVETVVYNFTSETGYPISNVVEDNAGNFYGVSYNGQLYQVSPGGVLSILNSGLDLGQNHPVSYGYMVQTASGNFYGEFYYNVYSGGNTYFHAGLWEVLGSDDALSVYDFLDGCSTGCTAPTPEAPLTLSGSSIYGTSLGGTSYEGAVFQFDESTGVETTLYSFCANLSSCSDGANPEWNVVPDSSGNLYGTTAYGGAHGFGTIFKLTKTN